MAYVLGMNNDNNKRIEIGIDNMGETFWGTVSAMPFKSVPKMVHTIRRVGFVCVSEAEADATRAWCEQVDGWDERPLRFIEV